jgi:hypothetical protein
MCWARGFGLACAVVGAYGLGPTRGMRALSYSVPTRCALGVMARWAVSGFAAVGSMLP